MCGDHPSFIKTDLNVKEKCNLEPEKLTPSPRLTPVTSRSERVSEPVQMARPSDHALRARRHSVDGPSREQGSVPANKALLQAALGSFRWPPYLLVVWMLLLLVTHLLHCLLTVLSSSLPHLKRICLHFRQWTEQAWNREMPSNTRFYPIVLACTTATLYTLYFGMYAMYSVVLWSIEPLNSDGVYEPAECEEAKVTNYLDMKDSKTKL